MDHHSNSNGFCLIFFRFFFLFFLSFSFVHKTTSASEIIIGSNLQSVPLLFVLCCLCCCRATIGSRPLTRVLSCVVFCSHKKPNLRSFDKSHQIKERNPTNPHDRLQNFQKNKFRFLFAFLKYFSRFSLVATPRVAPFKKNILSTQPSVPISISLFLYLGFVCRFSLSSASDVPTTSGHPRLWTTELSLSLSFPLTQAYFLFR